MNTYNGLYSLYFEKVHIACASASPEDIHSLIPGIPLTVISLCQYPVGFYVKKENPKNIRGFSDLTRADIIFVNREKGSKPSHPSLTVHFCLPKFHRIPYPDIEMSLLPITPRLLAVAGGQADDSSWRGLCSEKLSGAGFSSCLPGIHSSWLCRPKILSTPGFQAVAETIASEPFRRFLALQTGYDTTDTGNIRHSLGLRKTLM